MTRTRSPFERVWMTVWCDSWYYYGNKKGKKETPIRIFKRSRHSHVEPMSRRPVLFCDACGTLLPLPDATATVPCLRCKKRHSAALYETLSSQSASHPYAFQKPKYSVLSREKICEQQAQATVRFCFLSEEIADGGLKMSEC